MSRIYPMDYLQDLSSFLMAFALRALYLAVSSLRSQPKKAHPKAMLSVAGSSAHVVGSTSGPRWEGNTSSSSSHNFPQFRPTKLVTRCWEMALQHLCTNHHIPVLSQPSEILHDRLTSAKLPNPRFQYIIIHNIHIHIYICIYIYVCEYFEYIIQSWHCDVVNRLLSSDKCSRSARSCRATCQGDNVIHLLVYNALWSKVILVRPSWSASSKSSC